MKYTFALAGNPNSGKTTLFNALTGSKAHVGNFPGVTVERKEGFIRVGGDTVTLIDLPGIYSLSPYSAEEVVSRNFLLNEKPDLIINILDATHLERNLYLTTQLMETGIPLVAALNMMDEVEAEGDEIDTVALCELLGLPLIPISAAKNEGIPDLMNAAIERASEKNHTERYVTYPDELYKYTSEIRKHLNSKHGGSTFFTAVKLLERDGEITHSAAISDQSEQKIQELVDASEREPAVAAAGGKWDIIVGDARYKFIENITNRCVKKALPYGEQTLSGKIDRFITNKWLAFPIFALIMLFVFQMTFGAFGSYFADLADEFFAAFAGYAREFLTNSGASDWAVSLVCDGALAGVGMVIVFLPNVAILFFFLSILEDSGYMARAAFIMDRALKKVGLTGKAFVPMLMGFGCSIPGIMAARTLDNETDRKKTIIITPFISCSARMPVYLAFAGALFTNNQGIVILSLYLLGMVIAALSSLLLGKTVLKGGSGTFLMEMPEYRLPTLRNLIVHVWEKVKGFITKAGSILLIASVIIWLLQSFDFSFTMVNNSADSIFGSIGGVIAPLFIPLGFGDWRSSVSLLSGFVAKESVISALSILHEVDEGSLATALNSTFSPLSAYSYMVFVLLYLPCVGAFAVMKRELNSWKWTLFAVIYQTGTAYIVSLLIYQIGSLFL